MNCRDLLAVALTTMTTTCFASDSPYARWERGPSTDPSFFPIAVWLQSPSLAERYKAAGINTYVGLWRGPTEDHLAALKIAGMQVVCSQNDVGLKHLEDPTIIGWMHGDEPDNAQRRRDGGEGYGPPILPETIVAGYEMIRRADPSRPVLLNLGQGVAFDGYPGRGVRSNHPEDYPHYMKGADIVSFDIYPVATERPSIHAKLWLVPYGVSRLTSWKQDPQVVWNCIETTHIRNKIRATPHQVRSEVWMAIVRGSMGLIYFVHTWAPEVNEHKLLDDPEMLEAVTAINRQIRELAPVLNSPTVTEGVVAGSRNPDVPIAMMVKRHQGATYLFATSMRDGETEGRLTVEGVAGTVAEVLGEDRTVQIENGTITDTFTPYDVHIYRAR